MKLDDLQNNQNSQQLAGLLHKHYGVRIPVDRINQVQAEAMLESVQNRLNRFRNTPAAHKSEQDPHYLAMLMTEQVLQTKISEDSGATIGKALKTAAKQIGDTFKEKVPGTKSTQTSAYSFWDQGDSSSGLGKKSKKKSKTAKTATSKPSMPAIGNLSASQLTYLINKETPQNNTELARLFRSMSTHHNFKKALHMLKKPQTIAESLDLMESSVGEAEVVLAAKDLADRIQDMVETLGKMVNEEIPALTETIRDTMSAEQADAFNSSATETINSLLDTVRGSKDQMDAAARTLAGEEAVEPTEPTEMPAEEPADAEADLTGDEFAAAPAATGGTEEPLGRSKR